MRHGLTLIETLIVIVIIGIAATLLVPAVQAIRESALLTVSFNNLRQICLGLHQLGDSNRGRLPGVISSDPPYRAETFVELLPYLERQDLYKTYVDGPLSGWPPSYLSLPASIYLNPLDPSLGRSNPNLPFQAAWHSLSISSYAANAQFFATCPRIASITDGTSQTIWLTEHYGAYCNGTTFVYSVGTVSSWQPIQPATFAHGGGVPGRPAPGDLYPLTVGNPPVTTGSQPGMFQLQPSLDECTPRLPNSASSKGLQIAMADGSVRLVHPRISSTTFWSMITPSSGDVVTTD